MCYLFLLDYSFQECSELSLMAFTNSEMFTIEYYTLILIQDFYQISTKNNERTKDLKSKLIIKG